MGSRPAGLQRDLVREEIGSAVHQHREDQRQGHAALAAEGLAEEKQKQRQ